MWVGLRLYNLIALFHQQDNLAQFLYVSKLGLLPQTVIYYSVYAQNGSVLMGLS
jgi:hypothetical protein